MAGTTTRLGQNISGLGVNQGAGSVSGSGTPLDGSEVPFVYLGDELSPDKPGGGVDSTDANATQATAGWGIRGWLSTLVSLFRAGTAKFAMRTSATATESNVAGAAVSTTLLISNAARKGAIITNDSTAILYLLYGSGAASTTTYTYYIPGSSSGTPAVWEMPTEPVYTGQLTGIWASATGTARVTELT